MHWMLIATWMMHGLLDFVGLFMGREMGSAQFQAHCYGPYLVY